MSEENQESRGTFFLDVDDRRRLAVAEILMIAESNGGMVYPTQYGEAILHNVITKSHDEIVDLSDKVRTRLARIQNGGGY